MKVILLILICSFTLAGCNHKKSVEQADKEYRYYQVCSDNHISDGNFKECDKAFEKKFGYPYEPPGSDLK